MNRSATNMSNQHRPTTLRILSAYLSPAWANSITARPNDRAKKLCSHQPFWISHCSLL